MQQALRNDYAEAFLSHKELGKGIQKRKKELKNSDPEFKELETAVNKSRRAEDEYVVSKNTFLESLPEHRYRSEIELARDRLQRSDDIQLAALVVVTATRQATLEAGFPDAFAPIDDLVAERNARRQALNDNPEFQRRNREVSDAWQAFGVGPARPQPSCASSQRSASIAAMHPVPAAVTAWR